MFEKFLRAILPNPLDQILRKAKRKGHKRFLLGWNRGLGDIALGLYAVVHRIRTFVPDAEVVFMIRPNLQEGFQLFEGIKYIVAPNWKRGVPYDIKKTLQELGMNPAEYDVIIEYPNPTYWVKWQRGKLVPKLKWKKEHDALYKEYGLDENLTYIATQINAETNYGFWRNWPKERWLELFHRLENERKDVRILLFGFERDPVINNKNVIDLRGKTNLFQVLSIIKNLCDHLIVPDSGILSMTYYLDVSFPINVISLWGDPRHGILKQNVASPNPLLTHTPLIGAHRDLWTVHVDDVFRCLFPPVGAAL